jgi:hypothetical protein
MHRGQSKQGRQASKPSTSGGSQIRHGAATVPGSAGLQPGQPSGSTLPAAMGSAKGGGHAVAEASREEETEKAE